MDRYPDNPARIGRPGPMGPIGWGLMIRQAWSGLTGRLSPGGRSAIARLAASEERYRSVVEAQTEFVLRQRPDGRLTFVNEAYCRFTGMSREQLLDPNWCDLDHLLPEDKVCFFEHIARLTPENPVATIELRSIPRGGRERCTSWTDRGIFDAAGRLVEL